LNLTTLQAQVDRAGAPIAERNVVQRFMDAAGNRSMPEVQRTRAPDGRDLHVYLWRTAPGGPVALVTGPTSQGKLYRLRAFDGQGAGALIIPASTHGPALTSIETRRNSGFAALASSVAETATESAQVNKVVSSLASMGYAEAVNPDVYTTSIDGALFRVYVWRNTPLGDDVILGTGPSFAPKLALAADVPATPGVGVFVQAALAQGQPKTLQGAARAASRGARVVEREPVKPRERKPRERAVRAPSAEPRWVNTWAAFQKLRTPTLTDVGAENIAYRDAAGQQYITKIGDVDAADAAKILQAFGMTLRGFNMSEYGRDGRTIAQAPTPAPAKAAKPRAARAPKAPSASSEKAELMGGLNALAAKLAALAEAK
jgi:hypothetical protein